MTAKPALLFLCHRIPYPPNKGDKIRAYHLLKHLSEHYRVFLGSFVDDLLDRQHIPRLRSLCEDYLVLPLNPLTARARSLSALLQGKALSESYYYRAELQRWVRDVVAREGIQSAVLYSSPMAQYVLDPALGLQRRVMDFVDVDSDKWRQYAEKQSGLKAWVYAREAKKLLAFEQRVAKAVDASFLVSDPEAELLRQLAPDSAHKVDWYRNGVDANYFAPDPTLPNPYDELSQTLVFTGAMDYWPNEDAVVWFAREVLPLLQRKHPRLGLCIVGGKPTPAVRALIELPNVRVTDRVPDVRPYVQHALAAVAPLRVARGIQNKVLEAMAMAKPTLVSPMGLEGIDAQPGAEVLIAESAQDYGLWIDALLAGKHAEMGAAARAKVLAEFDWSRNLARVDRALGEAAA